jgi:hypothetical protein
MEGRSLCDKQCHPRGQNAKSSSAQAEIKAIRRFGSDRGASFPGSRLNFRRRPCSSLASHTVGGDSNRSTSCPSRTVSCSKAAITSKGAIRDPDHSEAIRRHHCSRCIFARRAAGSSRARCWGAAQFRLFVSHRSQWPGMHGLNALSHVWRWVYSAGRGRDRRSDFMPGPSGGCGQSVICTSQSRV